MLYNHGFDIAFSIETSEEEWDCITNRQALANLEARVAELKANLNDKLDSPVSDCFGYMDSYEID